MTAPVRRALSQSGVGEAHGSEQDLSFGGPPVTSLGFRAPGLGVTVLTFLMYR